MGLFLFSMWGLRVSSSSIKARQSRCQIRSTKSEARSKLESPEFKWQKQVENKDAIHQPGPKTMESCYSNGQLKARNLGEYWNIGMME
jgi:hypothetical protein